MIDSTTGRVFISYRREETGHVAGRLADWLSNRLGPRRVFMDVEDIEPGADFASQLDREVSLSKVLLAVIGREWATVVDENGRRRLDDPEDFVVLEIQAALDREIYVIPVLVDGAQIPRREALPPAMRRLVGRQAIRLGHETFSVDASRLLAVIRMRLDAASAVPESAEQGGRDDSRRRTAVLVQDPPTPRPDVARGVASVPGPRAPDEVHGPAAAGGGDASVDSLLSDRERLARAPVGPRGLRFLSWRAGPLAAAALTLALIVGVVVWRIAVPDGSDAGTGPSVAETPLPRKLWSVDVGKAVFGRPVLAANMMYVADRGGAMHAVDTGTGKIMWTRPINGVLASPFQVVRDTLYAWSADGHIHALRASNGQVRWSKRADVAIHSPPQIADNVIVVSGETAVYGFDLSLNHRRWLGYGRSAIAVSGRVLYAVSGGRRLRAVDAVTERLLWEQRIDHIASAPMVSDGVVIVGTRDKRLHALDARSRVARWPPRVADSVLSPVTAAGSATYWAASDGSLRVVDAGTGNLARFAIDGAGALASTLAVGSGLVCVGTSAERVVAVNGLTGTRLWDFPTAGVPASLLMNDGVLYIGSDTGHIDALRAAYPSRPPAPTAAPTSRMPSPPVRTRPGGPAQSHRPTPPQQPSPTPTPTTLSPPQSPSPDLSASTPATDG